MHRVALTLLAGCGAHLADGPEPTRDHPDAAPALDAAIDGALHLDTTPGAYREACDGSAAVAIDADHFASFSDSDEHLRIFQRGARTRADIDIDFTQAFDVGTDVADFEDAARVGDRIYLVGSHGRSSGGELRPSRFRFAAFDLVDGQPQLAGIDMHLVDDMLDASAWTAPATDTIAALAAATALDTPTATNLAPKIDGISIEGLAYAPTQATPERMLVGLRNPRPNHQALVIPLMNAAAAVAGAPARFGEPIALDLGDLGILGMTWSDMLHAVLFIAGPHDDSAGPFQLYRWSGLATDLPFLVTDLTVPPDAHPEAIVTYPNTTDVQILFDSDNVILYGHACDQAAVGEKQFADAILRID